MTSCHHIRHSPPQVVSKIWVPRLCGDDRCDRPEEFPAWGRFGCRADCGLAADLTDIAVSIRHDFADLGSGTLEVANRVAWNLCNRLQPSAIAVGGGIARTVCWCGSSSRDQPIQRSAHALSHCVVSVCSPHEIMLVWKREKNRTESTALIVRFPLSGPPQVGGRPAPWVR